MTRENLITELQSFLEFLLKNGYCDTDVYSEEPTALDQYLGSIGVNKGIDKPAEEVITGVDRILRDAITMVDPNDMGEVYPYIPADDEDLQNLVTRIASLYSGVSDEPLYRFKRDMDLGRMDKLVCLSFLEEVYPNPTPEISEEEIEKMADDYGDDNCKMDSDGREHFLNGAQAIRNLVYGEKKGGEG